MEQQNQQPVQEKVESKRPIKTNWKFIAIVMVFAVLVGGGALWYVRLFNQQMSQLETSNVTLQIPKEKKSEVDTSTWQTYRSEQLGLEMRYPREWLFAESRQGSFLDIHISNFGAQDFGCAEGFIGLEIQAGHTKDSKIEFSSSVRSILTELDVPSGYLDSIDVGDHQAFKASESGWDSACRGPGYIIEQDEGNYIYIFTGSYNQEDNVYFDQIVSTFRFAPIR